MYLWSRNPLGKYNRFWEVPDNVFKESEMIKSDITGSECTTQKPMIWCNPQVSDNNELDAPELVQSTFQDPYCSQRNPRTHENNEGDTALTKRGKTAWVSRWLGAICDTSFEAVYHCFAHTVVGRLLCVGWVQFATALTIVQKYL